MHARDRIKEGGDVWRHHWKQWEQRKLVTRHVLARHQIPILSDRNSHQWRQTGVDLSQSMVPAMIMTMCSWTLCAFYTVEDALLWPFEQRDAFVLVPGLCLVLDDSTRCVHINKPCQHRCRRPLPFHPLFVLFFFRFCLCTACLRSCVFSTYFYILGVVHPLAAVVLQCDWL
jgi:hypothetical protein